VGLQERGPAPSVGGATGAAATRRRSTGLTPPSLPRSPPPWIRRGPTSTSPASSSPTRPDLHIPGAVEASLAGASSSPSLLGAAPASSPPLPPSLSHGGTHRAVERPVRRGLCRSPSKRVRDGGRRTERDGSVPFPGRRCGGGGGKRPPGRFPGPFQAPGADSLMVW
jgi:hypothetical protein